MKRNLFIIPALAVVFSCCQKEVEMTSTVHSDTLSAVISTEDETRTSMSGNKVLWDADDEISVFSVNSGKDFINNKYSLTNGQGTSNATFSGSFEGTTKVAALYPYNTNNEFSATEMTVTLANEYQYVEGANNKAPMASLLTEEGENIVFNNAGALMALTVNNIPIGYNKATLEVADTDPSIAGSATITFTDDGKPILKSPAEGVKAVTISFTNDVVSNKTFYFPIPVADYSKLAFSITDGTETKVLKEKALKAERNKRYTSSITLDAINAEIPTSTTITNASEVLKVSNNISVENVPANVQDPTIVLPVETDNSTVNIAFETISTEEPITIDAANDEQVAETVNISVPTESDKAKLNIDLPNSTVTITVAGTSSAIIPEVTASTAENTLIVDDNITINLLTIVKGNIRVKKGAEIKVWKYAGEEREVKGKIYVEKGCKTPEIGALGDYYEIVEESTTTLREFLANNPSGTYTLTQNETVPLNTVIPAGVTIDGGEETKYSVTVDCDVTEGIGKGVFVLRGNSRIENLTFNSPYTQYDIIVENVGDGAVIHQCNFQTPTADDMGRGKRAIYSNSRTISGFLNVWSCIFNDHVYAFSFNQPNDMAAIFDHCELNGWLSGHGDYHYFSGCTFGKSGDYQNYIPYCEATFEGCSFEKDFKISLKHASDLNFINCTVAGNTIDDPNDINWDFSGDGQDNETSEKVTIGENSWTNAATDEANWFEPVAEIQALGETKGYYKSLSDAIAAVEDYDCIMILKDIDGATGVVIDTQKEFSIDFCNHTYTMSKPGVGSAGTTTLGFQILKDQNVTFRNGIIRCSESNKIYEWTSDSTEKGIAMMIQNYANLTLDNMTIDGTNIAHNGTNVRYIVSNNSGTVNFYGNTSIIAPAGDIAFDVCKYASYEDPTVNWCSTGNVVGRIELSGGTLVVPSEYTLKLTETVKAVSGNTDVNVEGSIIPSENWNGGDALFVVNRNAKLSLLSYQESGKIDAGYNDNIYAAVKMTEKGEENTTGQAVLGVEGVILRGYYYGISGNGNRHDTVIDIWKGDIGANCSEDGHAIYHPQEGVLRVADGTLAGYCSAIEMRAGVLDIYGGNFTSTCTPTDAQQNGSGTSIMGAAIAVSQHNTHKPIKLYIKGGVFNGASALYEEYTYNDNGFVGDDCEFLISGGEFNGAVYSENFDDFIRGGRYSQDPSDYVYNSNVENQGGYYVVTAKDDSTAQ